MGDKENMYKASIDLGRINPTMKLKFGLVLRDDNDSMYYKQLGKRKPKIVDKFSYNGNEYLNIYPSPFLTIDISASSDDKGAGWNPYSIVNITKDRLFLFSEQLKRMIDHFKEPDLFYLQHKTLYVNKQLSEDYKQSFSTYSKTVIMQHAVIMEPENPSQQYEGILFMINSPDNFCCLTYDELTHLYYEVSHTDLSVLSMQVLNMQALIALLEASNKMETVKLDNTEVGQKLITEQKNEFQDIIPPLPARKEIPDI